MNTTTTTPKVESIRRQLAAGKYETPEKLDAAADAAIDEALSLQWIPNVTGNPGMDALWNDKVVAWVKPTSDGDWIWTVRCDPCASHGTAESPDAAMVRASEVWRKMLAERRVP